MLCIYSILISFGFLGEEIQEKQEEQEEKIVEPGVNESCEPQESEKSQISVVFHKNLF